MISDEMLLRIIEIANAAVGRNRLSHSNGLWFDEETKEYMDENEVFEEAICIIEEVIV